MDNYACNPLIDFLKNQIGHDGRNFWIPPKFCMHDFFLFFICLCLHRIIS